MTQSVSPHPEGWRLESVGNLQFFHRAEQKELGKIQHAFSTRRGGCSRGPYASLNLGTGSGDRETLVEKNRNIFLDVLGRPPGGLRILRQVHSNRVVGLRQGKSEPPSPPQADALITDRTDIVIGVLTADCLPILLADRQRRVVAAIHVGWKGTVGGIVGIVLETLQKEWGCRPGDLRALIGPGVGGCCYQVGEEVYEPMRAWQAAAESCFQPDPEPGCDRKPRWHLDLAAVNRRELQRGGIPEGNIHHLPLCTSCRSEHFFSYRRDGAATGRMLAVIGLWPEN